MIRSLSCIYVLLGALTVAAASDTPAPAPHNLIGETEDGDPPTSNKLQDLAYAVDKDLWQLRAHLQKPSSGRGDPPWSGYQGR